MPAALQTPIGQLTYMCTTKLMVSCVAVPGVTCPTRQTCFWPATRQSDLMTFCPQQLQENGIYIKKNANHLRIHIILLYVAMHMYNFLHQLHVHAIPQLHQGYKTSQ